MFERFSDPSRQVVVLAQDEARALHHNYIGTEHILLGLLREERGLAARVLAAVNLKIESVRHEVREVVGEGDEAWSPAGQIPFTSRAKKVLELALREAQALGHEFIGTEHLLLGLARENDGVAMRILTGLGVGDERIRRETIRMMGGVGTRSLAPSGPAPSLGAPMGVRPPRRGQLVTAWVLGVATLGVGILLGWAIWG